MNTAKRDLLVKQLSGEPEPQLVAIEIFFDGNDDVGSIGCNLIDHPGIETFRAKFAQLAKRPDVEAIYAQIAEVDPGDDSWPFSDTVFVVGSISQDELSNELEVLEPDEVADGEEFGVPSTILERHSASVLAAWWD